MQGFIYWCAALKPLGIGNWRYALWQIMLLWCLVARKSILGAWKLCLKIEGCSFHSSWTRFFFPRKFMKVISFIPFISNEPPVCYPGFSLRWLPWTKVHRKFRCCSDGLLPSTEMARGNAATLNFGGSSKEVHPWKRRNVPRKSMVGSDVFPFFGDEFVRFQGCSFFLFGFVPSFSSFGFFGSLKNHPL